MKIYKNSKDENQNELTTTFDNLSILEKEWQLEQVEKNLITEKLKLKTEKNVVISVGNYLRHKQIEFDGNLIQLNKQTIAQIDLAREIYIYFKEKRYNFSKSDIHDVITQHIYINKKKKFESIKELIRYKESNNILEKWLSGVVVKDENFKIYKSVIEHFVWQVKRKVFGLKVDFHNMPIFRGKQKSGKTTAIKKLIGPLINYSFEPMMSIVNDSREYFSFTDNYICFFDELVRSQQADINALKRLITIDKLTYRILSKNENSVSPNNCTFIGATNSNIDEMIYDPTGMRRFFQIPCLDQLDWSLINSTDYIKIWTSVNENSSSPIFGCLAEVEELQLNITAHDSVEEWTLVCGIKFQPEDATAAELVCKTPSEIYSEYVKWIKEQMRKPVSEKKFGLRVKELGAVQFKSKGKRKYNYILTLDSDDNSAKAGQSPMVQTSLSIPDYNSKSPKSEPSCSTVKTITDEEFLNQIGANTEEN